MHNPRIRPQPRKAAARSPTVRVHLLRAFALCASLALLAACGSNGEGTVSESGETLRPVTLIYATQSGATWPLWMAQAGGYYEKHGLDVTLRFGVHPAGIATVVSGQAQGTNYSLEQALIAATRDSSLVVVGGSLNRALFALMANPEVESIADLRGRRIGVSQIGDAPYNYTVALLESFGLDSRDVNWLPVGTGVQGRAASLATGRVDATLLTAPAFFRMQEEGFNTLANLVDHDDVIASISYLLSRRAIQQYPELPERLIKAHAEAIQRFYEDREFAISAYLSYDDTGHDREDIERIYEHYAENDAFERIPYISAEAVHATVTQADTNAAPQLLTYDFRQVIDNSYIDRLIEEGFFEELFGPEILAEQERKAPLAFR